MNTLLFPLRQSAGYIYDQDDRIFAQVQYGTLTKEYEVREMAQIICDTLNAKYAPKTPENLILRANEALQVMAQASAIFAEIWDADGDLMETELGIFEHAYLDFSVMEDFATLNSQLQAWATDVQNRINNQK